MLPWDKIARSLDVSRSWRTVDAFPILSEFSFTDEELYSWWTYTDINPSSCEEFLRSRKFDVTQSYAREKENIFRARLKREKIHRRSRCRQGSSPFPFQEDTRARNSVLRYSCTTRENRGCFITPHLTTGNLLRCNTRRWLTSANPFSRR